MPNLDNNQFAAITRPAWNPRPGLDLDAGIRMQTGKELHRWPEVTAPFNQYDRFQNGFGFNPIMATVDHLAYMRVYLPDTSMGPLVGTQPSHESNRWTLGQMTFEALQKNALDNSGVY